MSVIEAGSIAIQEEIERQVDQAVNLGLHGGDESVFRAHFVTPRYVRQPTAYRDRLDILVVDFGLPISLVNRMLGISEWIPTDRFNDENSTPRTPFAFWTHDGSLYQGLTLEEARALFIEGEVESPFSSVQALYLAGRGVFPSQDFAVVSAQTRFGDYYLALSTLAGKQPETSLVPPNFNNLQRYGLLTQGKEVIQFI